MSALREIAAHFGVSFDDAALKKGAGALDGLVDSVKGFAKSLGAGLALGAVYHFVTGLTEEADALQKQADAMGLSLAEMQEWQYAAKMQNVEAETLNGVLAKLGSGKFDKGLAGLGVSTKDANGELRNSTDIMEDVADALQKIDNPAERNRKAVGVLGKSYTKLLPLLQDGSKGIKELRADFQALGGGFDEDFARNADEVGDNIDRMKLIWKNFSIMLLAKILPQLMILSQHVVRLVKPVIALVKNSKSLELAFGALGVKGLMFLSGKIGPLGTALRALAANFFTVIVPLLILEDFLTFLGGGDSLFGRGIEKIFGKNSADEVRKWIFGVWKSFTDFIDQIKNKPLSLLDDWEVFTNALDKDVKSVFGDTFGEMLGIAGSMFVGFIDILTGGWDNFTLKVGAVWDYMVIGARIVWDELSGGFAHLGALIADVFLDALNFFLMILNKMNGGFDKLLNKLGLLSDKEMAANQKFYDDKYLDSTLADQVQAGREVSRQKLVQDYDNTVAKFNRPTTGSSLVPTVGVQNQVNVTVPPGTPAQQAQAVAKAAQNGVNAGNAKATQAALKPGGVK